MQCKMHCFLKGICQVFLFDVRFVRLKVTRQALWTKTCQGHIDRVPILFFSISVKHSFRHLFSNAIIMITNKNTCFSNLLSCYLSQFYYYNNLFVQTHSINLSSWSSLYCSHSFVSCACVQLQSLHIFTYKTK